MRKIMPFPQRTLALGEMWCACIAVVRVDHLWYYIAACTTAMSADVYKKFKMRCNRFSHDGERKRERERGGGEREKRGERDSQDYLLRMDFT